MSVAPSPHPGVSARPDDHIIVEAIELLDRYRLDYLLRILQSGDWSQSKRFAQLLALPPALVIRDIRRHLPYSSQVIGEATKLPAGAEQMMRSVSEVPAPPDFAAECQLNVTAIKLECRQGCFELATRLLEQHLNVGFVQQQTVAEINTAACRHYGEAVWGEVIICLIESVE